MEKRVQVSIPAIKNIKTALQVYYSTTRLFNSDIRQLFGPISSATVCKLKDLARAKMNERDVLLYNSTAVDTAIAYEAWGIDIDDLERRYKKLEKFGFLSQESQQSTSAAK